jgi:gliding motility-associated-like protein
MSLINTSVWAQSVSVDVSNTPEQLVEILMDASCSIRSNQRISSPQSVGSFKNNNSSFPISEGIIIRNGNVLLSQGTYTGQGLSSQLTTAGDPDLQDISNSSGQISTILDVGYLEFDFVPNGNQFNFNFLFASNEYGEWQCGFSDVFAFLLTDLTTGETTNLAVVPGTETPISVKDIRNSAFNSSCNSVNANLFSTYNVNDPSSSSLNMRGYTVVMNAFSEVTPGSPYRIRLAIGDYNDSDFDSAVFIEAGSFSSFVSLGEDQNLCGNDAITLDTGITDTNNYSFTWSKNGTPIANEANPSLIVSDAGTYDVTVTTSNGCTLTDQIVITDLNIGVPTNITACNNGSSGLFDLTANNEIALGVDPIKYEAVFFASQMDLDNDNPIPSDELTSYQSVGGQTIYIKLRNKNIGTYCNAIIDFELLLNSFQVNDPDDFNVCQNIATIDIPAIVEGQILNGLNPFNYTITYHPSLDDATNGENAIVSPASFITPALSATLWARTTDNTFGCFEVVDFDLNITAIPIIEELPDVVVCDSFSLPPLTSGGYYPLPGGNGTPYNFGDLIESSKRIYIYNVNDEGCSIETSFRVEVLQSYEIETEHCSQFIIPTPPSGGFFTQPNGPNGSGVELEIGTSITSNQTIYFFAEFDGAPCVDIPFDIVIHTPPAVDEFNDVIVCDSYTLPNLTNGTYFNGTGGSGGALLPGTILTSSSTIYIFSDDGQCTNESSFKVNIVQPADFVDRTNCGSYTLTNPGFGGYFTAPGGNGNTIPVGTVIDQSTRVYYYVPTTEGTNCTADLFFDVTILPVPEVSDHLTDVVRCVNDPYVLETIEFGNYFTEANGQGSQLNPGDTISSSQTVYIYSSNTFCSNEHSFNVEIRPLPSVDNFTDIFVCNPYVLPELSNGTYHTAPNGQGAQLSAGDIISSTQTIYIYNAYTDLAACASENVFTVNVLGVTVDHLESIDVCDSYTLPTLTAGEYFTEPYGQGARLAPGDIITSTQTIYIYAENGNRFFCFDNHEFTVTVSSTPPLQHFENQERCGTFTLETINTPEISVTYYRQSGGVNQIDPSEYTLTEPGIYTIHARTANASNPNCYVDEVFGITIHPLKELVIEDAIICVDAESGLTTQSTLLRSGLDPAVFEVSWYLNGSLMGEGIDYEATEAGIYTVEVVKLIPDVGNDCSYAPTQVEVKESSPEAKITFLTEPFDPQTNIRVDFLDPGLGTYEYQLNNGPFQASNIFLDIPFGNHIVTIRDTSNLCGNLQVSFKAMGYPQFFTPNGDGINDTWNIPDLRNNTTARIKIFDRYGNFIKQISPSGVGWDGLSNSGSQLPSNSYWFKVEYTFEGETKTFSSYFALKRR